MALITWNEALEVGIETIDAQHHVLADLVNAIHDKLMKGAPDDDVWDAFALLADAAAEHFRYEEDLFARHAYPHSERHKRKHGLLLVVLERFQETLDRADRPVRLEEHLDYLHEWLLDHIEDEDRPLAAHLKRAGMH